MKLITNFHDYYDTPFQHSAVDPKHIFKRETAVLQLRSECSKFIYSGSPYINEDYRKCLFKGCIGFCGKLYPFIIYKPLGQDNEIFYSTMDLQKKHPELLKNPSHKRRSFLNTSNNYDQWLDKGMIKKWIDVYELYKDQQLLAIFEKYKTAYFLITGENWAEMTLRDRSSIVVTLYPNLKDYQFFKVFDTYHAFQAIEQYLTNNLVKPDMIEIKIPDKLKAESKGFDKWSFRKMSEKA